MRISVWLVSLFITFILSQSAMADTPVVPYSGVWSGTIGVAKVQVLFSEDGYYSNYYYIKHKSPIRLERSEKDPSEWNENIGHWEAKITGIWKLEQVSANSIKGVWINPNTKDKLPIELKLVAALIKDENGVADISAAFYAPIIDSLVYRYGTAKMGETRAIETDSGTSFEVSTKMKNAQKLNKYALEWLKEQAIASYDCQLSGGGGWERSLTPQFIIGDFLIIEDNLPDTFCGGAHGTWSHTHIVYDLNKGDFVDTRSWIKDFDKTSYGDNDGKTKFRELIESLNSCSEEDNSYFSPDAPYPTKEGLVFRTSHPYVMRACDEDITVPYKDMAPYLTPAGKKAISSVIPGLTFAPSLTDAVSDGDIEGVRSLVAAGADVNAKDIYDMTPLEIAVSKGYTDIARLLISKGADINVKDKKGDTLLNRALKKGSVETARFLVEQGADVNIPDSEGVPPLTIALSDKNLIALASLIISKGADIKKKDEDGDTFLTIVLFGKDFYYSYDNDKYKALRALSTKERLDIARVLVSKGADVNEKDSNGNPLLHRVVGKGNIEIIKFLLENKADTNAKDTNGRTPLHLAVDQGNKEVAELLIAKGVDVNAKNNNGDTPLYLAVDQGNKEVAELLIAKGANMNAKNNNGDTSLHWAAYQGNKEIAELLIAKGADMNAKNDHGNTPLYLVAKQGRKEIAELLIAKGADMNAKNDYGDTPLHATFVVIYRYGNITPLDLAEDQGRKEVAELLIAKGADVNAKNNNGDIPLHWATYNGYKEIIEILIIKGADVNAKNNDGQTPLDMAKTEYIRKILLIYGAKPGK